MIPSVHEIVAALYGAWRLVVMDRDAMRYFNVSVEGFWRSFFAAVLVVPYYLLVLPWPHTASGTLATPDAGWIASAVAAYVLDWITFPLVLAVLCRVFGLAGSYVAFIIAFNWTSALSTVPQAVPELLYQGGLIGPDPYNSLQLVVYVAVLWYTWVVARIGFGASAMTAVGLVILANLIDITYSLLFLAPPG